MTTIKSFIERLKKIGIEVELSGNYPWIYLEKVNGHKIHERYLGNHGFTVFFEAWKYNHPHKERITRISTIFKKIREVLENNGEPPQPKEDYDS